VDILFVDAIGHAAMMGVRLRPAAGDDVLADLGGELLGALLVEIDDGRYVAGNVRDEEVANRGAVRHAYILGR
jgi:hypothetical protein